MPVGQRGQRAHPPPLITLCTDQELLLSSAWLSHLKRRRCLRDLAKVVFVCPSPASLFSLVERWMVGNKKTCARYLWCINKRLWGWGREGWGGEFEGRCGGRVYTNQHPPPLSHGNEAVGISRTLLLPEVNGARKRLAAAGQMDLILLNANDISPFSSLAPCHY